MKACISYLRSVACGVSIMLLLLSLAGCRLQSGQTDKDAVRIDETLFEGRAHYHVQTKTLDYYFDIMGGGFSRIIDKQGNDWIGFEMEPWGIYPASAASSYRGLPNLVFQGDDDGAGHPGHDKCTSRIESMRIVTESLSGLWKWSWEFHKDHAILEILKTDPERAYWFLYEGTPGGRYFPQETYFGSNMGGPYPAFYDYYKGDILWESFRWIYAWSEQAEGTFFMVQEENDSHMDLISFLGNNENGLNSPDGMTVFGFGRDQEVNPLMKRKQRFIIGLYPQHIEDNTQHQNLQKFIETTFLKQ